MRWMTIISLLLWLTGCRAIVPDDETALLESDLQNYSAEVEQLQAQMQADRTAIAVTIASASTQSARHGRYNQIVQPTTSAAMPDSTPSAPDFDMDMVNSTGPMPVELFDLSDGQTRFVQVGAASEIDSRRCFVAHQSFFNDTTSVIYSVALGLNVRVGTSVRVEWRYGGDLVHVSTWQSSQSVDGQCVALEMRPSNAPFLPGNWTATMFVNGDPVDPTPFTIVAR